MPNWKEITEQFTAKRRESERAAAQAADLIRRGYLKELHEHTGRNVIAYYSGFLSKPTVEGIQVNNEDLNGFMAAVHQLDRGKGLDLIIHTPGGGMSAAISIVNYLRQMFDSDIRAIVPQIAMSAGTMIACSCRRIAMAKHSQLGPTDPQLGGIAAAGVKQEFLRACREIRKDPTRIAIWQPIIGHYAPTFLSQCENAVAASKEFVRTQLESNMFAGADDRKRRARKVVKTLTDYSGNKSHDRPIFVDECEKIGLHIERIEKDQRFQDLVLSAHHCYMFAFMNGPSFKIIENHLGTAIIKQVQLQIIQQ